MKKIFLVFILCFLITSGIPRGALAFAPPAIDANNKGVESYSEEKYGEAFEKFAGALARDPMNPVFHFNLGDNFSKGGEIPKALSEYESVASNPRATPELKFQAMFNAGNAAVESKDTSKALKYYQRALGFRPDSMETKTNIELLLQQQEKKGGGGNNDQQQDQKQNQDQNKDQSKNDKQQQDQNKNGDKDNKNKQQNQPNKGPEPKPTPHGFKSQALNEGDVRRILDELKRQEEQIRAKNLRENKTNDKPTDKDW